MSVKGSKNDKKEQVIKSEAAIMIEKGLVLENADVFSDIKMSATKALGNNLKMRIIDTRGQSGLVQRTMISDTSLAN